MGVMGSAEGTNAGYGHYVCEAVGEGAQGQAWKISAKGPMPYRLEVFDFSAAKVTWMTTGDNAEWESYPLVWAVRIGMTTRFEMTKVTCHGW